MMNETERKLLEEAAQYVGFYIKLCMDRDNAPLEDPVKLPRGPVDWLRKYEAWQDCTR